MNKFFEIFGRKPVAVAPHVSVERVGMFSQVDKDGLDESQQQELLMGRIREMKGSYASTPGGVVAFMARAQEICAQRGTNVVTLEIMHDALATILTYGGSTVDLTDPESVDRAWKAAFEREYRSGLVEEFGEDVLRHIPPGV